MKYGFHGNETILNGKISIDKLNKNSLNICSINLDNNMETNVENVEETPNSKNFEENSSRKLNEKYLYLVINFLENTNISSIAPTDIPNEILKRIPDEYDEFSGIYETFGKKQNLLEILAIVFYRLRILCQNQNKYGEKFNLYTFIALVNIQSIYNNIMTNFDNDTYAKFFLCLLLHSSRGFVDPDTESLKTSAQVMDENSAIDSSCFYSVQELIQKEKHGVIVNACNLLNLIYNSEKFISGLKKLIMKYFEDYENLELETSKAVDNFKTHLNSIIFVKDAFFAGMCGMDGKIYVSIDSRLEKALFRAHLPPDVDEIAAFIEHSPSCNVSFFAQTIYA